MVRKNMSKQPFLHKNERITNAFASIKSMEILTEVYWQTVFILLQIFFNVYLKWRMLK